MRFALLALCLLAACAPEASDPRAPTPAVRPAAPTGTPRIAGEWRLVEMNGRTSSQPQGESGPPTPITMTVGDSSFRAQSQCVAFWRRYEWRAGSLVVTPANPGAMCARGLSPWENEFSRTLSAVTDANVQNGMMRLSGPAANLTFQPAPPLPRESFTGRWRLRSVGGTAPSNAGAPLEITVTDDRITANACVFTGWRYRQDGRLLEVTETQGPVCERTSTELETRFVAFMRDLNRATITQDGTLILDSAAEQVEFSRLE